MAVAFDEAGHHELAVGVQALRILINLTAPGRRIVPQRHHPATLAYDHSGGAVVFRSCGFYAGAADAGPDFGVEDE